MGRPLKFEEAFPNEERKPIEQYLAGGCRRFMLNCATYFLSFKDDNSQVASFRKFLSTFRQENSSIVNQVYDRIKEVENDGHQVVIINTYSSLNLFELFFSKPEEPETQTQAEFEVNLLKAYLALSSEYAQKQLIALASTSDLDGDLKKPMRVFCKEYPVWDKSNYEFSEIWMTQLFKSIILFQFLETEIATKPLLKAFLTHFNCQTWQEYLKIILGLTITKATEGKEGQTYIKVPRNNDFKKVCAFIKNLVVHEQDDLDKDDFCAIRAKPLYKVEDGVYGIIFNLFVLEKIYKGVYFQLNIIYNSLPEENKFGDFKSYYGDKFSEKTLCYKVIESIYLDKCIQFSGKKLEGMKDTHPPDYYVRKGKDILLIESKDFLVAADKKMSFDFNIYEKEFRRILDCGKNENGTIKRKAVKQLIYSIRRILKKEFPADTNYDESEIYIYPVLLTYDHQYDTPGFNELIDFWFQHELQELKKEGLFIHQVKPLSVVNIDSLIFNQVALANDVPLHEMLNQYHENKKVEQEVRSDQFTPFSSFIKNYFGEKGLWKPPPLLALVTPALFGDAKQARL